MEALMLIILSFFAIYGAMNMLFTGVSLHYRDKEDGKISEHRVIMVKDGAEYIESVVRSLAWQNVNEEVVIIDTGSTDETPEIAQRLAVEYDFLLYLSRDEYIRYVDACREI